MTFFTTHKWVFIFYASVILLVFIFRKKFEMHGILALYRTKVGIISMQRMADRYRELIKLTGYIGIGAAYIGLLAISIFLIKNLFDLFTKENVQSAVTPVLPGISIPGSGFTLPLIAGWLSLFVVVVIHEFSHGVVAKAHGLKVKSSGLFFMGPLMGAFVEPDEKLLRKAPDTVQYSIYAAGPFSNMLTAGIAILLAIFVFPSVQGLFVAPAGFELQNVIDGLPASQGGLKNGDVITSINGVQINDRDTFVEYMEYVRVGDSMAVIAGSTEHTVIPVANPDNGKTAYIGILGSTHFAMKSASAFASFFYMIYKEIAAFFTLLGILSLGIGLINLFPIFMTDGARMLQVSLVKLTDETRGISLWKQANIICLVVLLLSLFWPLFKWLFGILMPG